jgi:hypothetical protein
MAKKPRSKPRKLDTGKINPAALRRGGKCGW